MISVFTPSHDPRWLDECYASLKIQTTPNWEWVVYLNGGAYWEPPDDERVHVVIENETMGVGSAKRNAVNWCKGTILLELDHDDVLMPDAVAEVQRAFDENPEASLVYSDFEQMCADGSPDSARFNEAHGWRYDGNTCLSFEPYPSMVSYIWYGPNHLRAVRRSDYAAVGGYDASLYVLDDQDLYCRLYQRGPFVHIPKMLYRQRVHDENTQSQPEINAQIQSDTVTMYDRYMQANALAWAKREKLRCLDLGGAHNPAPGYETVDLHDANITGDVMDVLRSLPGDSIGVIRAVDFLEHIRDSVGLMNECWRVLAHGGMLLSLTPSTDGRGAFQDPTHVSFWNENSIWYYTDQNYARFVPEITCCFQVSRVMTHYPTQWHEQYDISYLCANLIADKGGPRLPGISGFRGTVESDLIHGAAT